MRFRFPTPHRPSRNRNREPQCQAGLEPSICVEVTPSDTAGALNWLPRWLEPRLAARLFRSEEAAVKIGLHARTVGPELLELAAEFETCKAETRIPTPELDALLQSVRTW